MAKISKCPKCNGSMQEGWIPDWSHGGIRCLEWTPGQPEHAWLGNYKTPTDRAPIIAYSCCDCGYIELYVSRGA